MKKARSEQSLYENKEELGWKILAEKSLQEIWNNTKDNKLWKKYLRAKRIWNLEPIISPESTQKIKDELRKGW